MNAKLLCLLLLLFSAYSNATPQVGDETRYHLFVTIDGKVQFNGIETKKITAYDIENNQYFLETTNDGNILDDTYDVNPSEKKWVAADDLADGADLADTVRACGTANAPGRLRFPKVRGKRVAVCEQDMNNGKTQIGFVPFGYVSYHYQFKNKGKLFFIKQKLLSYKFGKPSKQELK